MIVYYPRVKSGGATPENTQYYTTSAKYTVLLGFRTALKTFCHQLLNLRWLCVILATGEYQDATVPSGVGTAAGVQQRGDATGLQARVNTTCRRALERNM